MRLGCDGSLTNRRARAEKHAGQEGLLRGDGKSAPFLESLDDAEECLSIRRRGDQQGEIVRKGKMVEVTYARNPVADPRSLEESEQVRLSLLSLFLLLLLLLLLLICICLCMYVCRYYYYCHGYCYYSIFVTIMIVIVSTKYYYYYYYYY